MKQLTQTISYPNEERSLHYELVRISNLTYIPVSQLTRSAIRLGLKQMPEIKRMSSVNA